MTLLLDGVLVGAAQHNRGTAAVRKAARLLGSNLGPGGRVRRNVNHSTGSRSRRPKTPSQQKPGQSQQFLGVRVGIPALDGVESILLPYTHFSVLMRLDKRLAAVTALGIDGTKLIDLNRSGIHWRLDPRLRADQQTGEMVYAGNDIDRGHLVRRASAVWGETRSEAARANADTFHYTDAAPQAAKFNQGMDLWLGLESYLQDNAADNGRRLVVLRARSSVTQTWSIGRCRFR